jgi:hypothetical protein
MSKSQGPHSHININNVPKIADSKSLHNYTLSPGWSKEEVEILKIALMKFGISRWKHIIKYVILISQIYLDLGVSPQKLFLR